MFTIILELSIEIVEHLEDELIAGPSRDVQSIHDLPVVEKQKTKNTRQNISKKRKKSPEHCIGWKKNVNHCVTIPDYNHFEGINSLIFIKKVPQYNIYIIYTYIVLNIITQYYTYVYILYIMY